MTGLTAVVITKNEESALPACLQAISFCDQVVVVDSMSTDATAQIARERGAEVLDFVWDGSYPKKKQWGLEHPAIANDWVLLLDADEIVTPSLADEIRRLIGADDGVVAYDIPLDYYFAGRQLRHGHKVSKRSLVDRRHVAFPVVDDLDAAGGNEVEGHYQPEAKGPIGRATGTLVHHDPDPVATWVERHNRYAGWEAHLRTDPERRLQVRGARSRQGQLFDRAPAKPLLFFVFSYIVRQGFRDGRSGFDYAFGLAWYYWLIGVKIREATRVQEARP